jgi:sugar/nucleoside kinase (ribokinase family)
VIIKLGSHGSVLSGPGGLFLCPAYPLRTVVDPTGAGDSFVGGMMGWLAAARGGVEKNLRQAMIYGSVVASFCCEGFGVQRTARLDRRQIEERVKELRAMTRV